MFAEALLASLIATNSTCVDMGQLYNDYVINECINYYSVPANIEQKKLDKKLGAMFRSFKANGTSVLHLSQAQLLDLELLAKDLGVVKASNSISTMMAPGYMTGPYTVGNTKQSFFQYFSDYAKKSGSRIALMFGGPKATSADMKIGPLASQQVKSLIKKYNLANITVDLRGDAAKYLFEQNKAEDIQKFLQEIRCVSLVVDTNFDKTKEALKPLFSRLNKLFSGITVTLETAEDNSVDFSKVSAEIGRWSNVFNPKNIHIAFSDMATYTLPDVATPKVGTKKIKKAKIAHGKGKKPAAVVTSHPSNLTNGQNAARMFSMLRKKIGSNLGDPVFCTENTLQLESNKFIKDFEAFLKK